jgi:hypothetical protein
MANQEVVVGDLVVTVLDVGTGKTREQEVVVEFTSIKTTDPTPARETWKVTIPSGLADAILSLIQQYEYSLSEDEAFKDLVAENPFTVRVQKRAP